MLILVGAGVELVMAGYCMVTAPLWKQFWKPDDFWHADDSRRAIFLGFAEECLACRGFVLLVVGAHGSPRSFLEHPFA